MLKKVEKQIIREIRSSLSDSVLEYIVYIDSGYDTYKAFSLLANREDGSYVTKEFYKTLNMIQNGDPFQRAINAVSDEYYEPGLDSFIRIISRSYLRGEEGSIDNLRVLIERILYEEILSSKENAEKASTKLSFPITLIFIAIILISVYPALTQFKI